jgi:restriction endonuclease S subunit
MNINNDFVSRSVNEIISDPSYRLDVLYWKNFAIDFNSNSQFTPQPLSDIGEIRNDTIDQQAIIKEFYYTFRITYKGEVVLNEPVNTNDIPISKFKVVKEGDLVFSRINCCRGAIGIIKEFQNDAICTNETHIFTVKNSNVDNRYLHIILRHPYYQDRILSKSTGASLERMRFPEGALLEFEVPIPPIEKQLYLIRQVKRQDEIIIQNTELIERLRLERNKYVLNELGIDLIFKEANEDFYALSLARLKNLTQHFGILGGILKEGVRDGKWEVSAVRAV